MRQKVSEVALEVVYSRILGRVPHLQGPWFNPELGIMSVWVEFHPFCV